MVKELEKLKNRAAALFLAPGLGLYLLFVIGPLIFSVYYSFVKWNGVGAKEFVGIANYIKLYKFDQFWIAFMNNMKLIIVSLIVQVPSAFIFAYLLYRNTKGYKAFRAILFLPVVVSPIAIGAMFSIFYNSEIGLFNVLLDALHMGSLKRQWLSDPKILLYSVMAPQVWQFIGYHMVIQFAAMQSIPHQVIESASIDGAGSTGILFRIVLPMMWDVIQISIILCVTGSLKAFGHSWIMTQGGPGVRSSYLTVLMFRMAFLERNFGMSSAISLNIVVMALLFTVVFKRMAKRSSIEY
ncbi:MAG: sugar ABC transporter permease [Spirochaetales bacterium]|nr:sugar ABC transporter permease [Spirochaetales bacterium]